MLQLVYMYSLKIRKTKPVKHFTMR